MASSFPTKMQSNIAETAAKAGGAVIREALNRQGFGRPNRVNFKGATDMVTEVDLAAEEAVCGTLRQYTPNVPILAEESSAAQMGKDLPSRWIVDPLDGTTNFVHGFPSFAVSVALEVDGELTQGCIYDPIHDRAFSAIRGRGATCNGDPIHVSQTQTLNHSLLLTGFAYDRRERADFYLTFVKKFLETGQGLRRMGAAAMDFTSIAVGQADGYWEFGLNAWDVAAGILLVTEAGGVVTSMDGQALDIDQPQILATNGLIHQEMSSILISLLTTHPETKKESTL